MPENMSQATSYPDREFREKPVRNSLQASIDQAEAALLELQKDDGHWCFELEADCTIPAEYILMNHFMGHLEPALEKRIGVYLRRNQNEDGSWPLYYGGAGNISCSVKAYYALKAVGDDINAEHMKKAREWILSQGGAAKCNVFTRILLVFFRQIPWRAIPFIPVEIMLLPKWFPFHLSKVSYWSRTVMVPLFILYSKRAKAVNPHNINVRELFTTPPEQEKRYFPTRSRLNKAVLILERIGRNFEWAIPGFVHRHATEKAEAWFIERLNGEDGLGAIFPAMVNAYEALVLLGYPKDHPHVQTALNAIRKLLVEREEEAYCQPCLSPVWDTGLAALSLQEVNSERSRIATEKALDWLRPQQLLEFKGDWKEMFPDLPGGGWPFQYANGHYPDLDDTAVVAYSMHKQNPGKYSHNIERAAIWLTGMQSRNGGFAAFDADNTHYYLNEIPFADHGALLDPPTEDVSARVLMFLSRIDPQGKNYGKAMQRCLDYLGKVQDNDGSWWGRWGTNYIYGTWSVLMALGQCGLTINDPRVAKAVEWLESVQREDGGWGEGNDSYEDSQLRGYEKYSMAHSTAWALLGILAVGEYQRQSVQRGIQWLIDSQLDNGLWDHPDFTAPGFPRVFYLKYHGYAKFFPLWALARYRNLCAEE